MQSFGNFIKLYQEAIPLKDAKKRNLTRKYSGAYSQYLDAIFENKDRLFIPIKIDYTDKPLPPIAIKIRKILNDHGYTIANTSDYIDGMAITSSREGHKNKTRIGKLLQKFEEDGTITVTTRKNGRKTTKEVIGKPLLHEFKNDPIRNKSGDSFFIVISRHPYDVSGSSTDRNWTSCMDLGTTRINYKDSSPNVGSNNKYVKNDVSEGTLVAYLVTSEDIYKDLNNKIKTTLSRPLSRILMKPHKTNDGKIAYSIGSSYGNKYDEFNEKVMEWVQTTLNTNTKGHKFYKNPKLYNDGDMAVGFEFSYGSEVADEVIRELLEWNNYKYVDNQIQFESMTTDTHLKYVLNINIELEDNSKIKSDLSDIDGLSLSYFKNNLNHFDIFVQKLCRIIFSELKTPSRHWSYGEESISVNNDGEGLTILMDTGWIRLRSDYDDESEIYDDDHIYDTLTHHIEYLKNFEYTSLKKEITSLVKTFNWDEEIKRREQIESESLHTLEEELKKLPPRNIKFKFYIPEDYESSEDAKIIYAEIFEIVKSIKAAKNISSKLIPPHVKWPHSEYTSKQYKIIHTYIKDTFNIPESFIEDYDDYYSLNKVFKYSLGDKEHFTWVMNIRSVYSDIYSLMRMKFHTSQ